MQDNIIANGVIKFPKPSHSSGFYSNYFSVLSTMMRTIEYRYHPYVDSSQSWFNPTFDVNTDSISDETINPWNWWFDQHKIESLPSITVDIFREYISHKPNEFVLTPIMDKMRYVANSYMPIKDTILNEAHHHFDTLLSGKTNLGIMARGTENLIFHLEYSKVVAESWPDIISRYMETHTDINQIFLVSDDDEIIHSIKNKFNNVVLLDGFFRRTTQPKEIINDLNRRHKPWWVDAPDGDAERHLRKIGEESLIQPLLLASCDYFIGSYSGFTNATYFFNETKFKHSILV